MVATMTVPSEELAPSPVAVARQVVVDGQVMVPTAVGGNGRRSVAVGR
jgi:hypothetical protein